MKNVLGALVALSLTATPALAADTARATAPTSKQSDIFGGGSVLFLIAAAVAIAGIVVIIADDNNNNPDSP